MLETSGGMIRESNAICRYLAGMGSGNLYPTAQSPAQDVRAFIDGWIDWSFGDLPYRSDTSLQYCIAGSMAAGRCHSSHRTAAKLHPLCESRRVSSACSYYIRLLQSCMALVGQCMHAEHLQHFLAICVHSCLEDLTSGTGPMLQSSQNCGRIWCCRCWDGLLGTRGPITALLSHWQIYLLC